MSRLCEGGGCDLRCGKIVEEIASGKQTSMDIGAFAVERFD
jgi:hypothetical protein